ncbi:MAG TPA: hypothetical protein VGJ97_08060 [Anaerolineaceae bacterium]
MAEDCPPRERGQPSARATWAALCASPSWIVSSVAHSPAGQKREMGKIAGRLKLLR